jgi:hypothetical protein
MKKLLTILALIISAFSFAQSGSYNPIYGKQDFKDTLRFSKYKNTAGDSILTTDGTGKLKLIKFTGSGGVDSSVFTICSYAPDISYVVFCNLYGSTDTLRWVGTGTGFDSTYIYEKIKQDSLALVAEINLKANKITTLSDATDADFTMTVNGNKYLPPSILTADKTITIPAGVDGDVMIITNNETGFRWLISGSIYLSDNTTLVTELLANTTYRIEKISGKWRVTN